MHTYQNMKDFLQQDVANLPWPWEAFLPHLLEKMNQHITNRWKILLLTLTKKSSEEICNFLLSKWYRAYYLHSEINTMDRREIINKLRSGEIDILVGINLLREWIDLPEVTLIAILDADKEWFLRSTTSLVQIIWRAARNTKSEVVLYGDGITESMIKALWETYRRRMLQINHNIAHNITPTIAKSNVKNLTVVKTDEVLKQDFNLVTRWKTKRLKKLTLREKELMKKTLKKQMDEAIKSREFEKAAFLRDQLKEIEED